jgi:hypothetical protein
MYSHAITVCYLTELLYCQHMTLKVHERQIGQENDVAIVLPYTWGGDEHNNRDLIGDVALLTGSLVIGVQTPGTGTFYVNHRTRKGLQPGNLAGLAEDFAGEVHNHLEKHGLPRRLLVAQSGRVALGARMQTSAHRPFTHVLLRDGVNLMAPESVREGYYRLTHQDPTPEYATYNPRRTLLHKMQDKIAAGHQMVEVLTQGKLLCSTESMEAVQDLARDTTTPLYHLTFTRGICGSVEDQGRFSLSLAALRVVHGQTEAGAADKEGFVAPLTTAVWPANHTDLLNPMLLHTHINYALDLHGPPPDPTSAAPLHVPTR